jgi:hypothetical protein
MLYQESSAPPVNYNNYGQQEIQRKEVRFLKLTVHFFKKNLILTINLRFYCCCEYQHLQLITSQGGTTYVLSQGGTSYTTLINQVIAEAKSLNQNYEDILSSQMTGSYMDMLNEPFPLEVFTCSLYIHVDYFVFFKYMFKCVTVNIFCYL